MPDTHPAPPSTAPQQQPLLGFSLLSSRHLALLIFLFIALASIGYLSTLSLLKIDMETSVDSEMQVFWANEHDYFSEQQSNTTQVKKGRHTYWIWIDHFNKSTQFRIDPVNQKSMISLYDTKLYSLHYFPVEFNLAHDAIRSNEIKILNIPDPSQPYIEFQSLGTDPQIEIRVIHSTSPLIYIALFVLIAVYFFGRKAFTQAIAFILISLFLSYLLSFSGTRISFAAHTQSPEQIKLFWRNTQQEISTTRAQKLYTQQGDHQYSFNMAYISNIDALYLEASNQQVLQNIESFKLHTPGFEDIRFKAPDVALSKQSNASSLKGYIALFAVFYVLLLLSFLYFLKNKRFLHAFFPKFLKTCLLFASALVFSLAWQADYNIHPDENAHIESTKYFSQYWLPPKVGDARAEKAYQDPWATSRLDDLGISYFFAGKFSLLVKKVFLDDTFINRAFNSLLFVALFVMASNKRFLFFLTPLLCSPQIWYLYSYANRGGFVLFVSILLAWQLANKKSALNQFLETDKVFSRWQYALFPGILLGILSIEQTNYLLFILFVFAVLFWELLFFVKQKKTFIYKCLFFLLIAASLFFIRQGIDISINGSNKLEQRIAYAEENAAPDFKPSIAETDQSSRGLRLKAKGYSLADIFQHKWEWHKMSFKSFTGAYGYYPEYSPKWYYAFVVLIYCILVGMILRHAIFKASLRDNLFTALSASAIAGGILISLLFSWVYDFQPQGRYIFPVIPIILVYFWKMMPQWNRLEKAVLLSSVCTLVLLSFYSYREVALNYLFS